MYMRVSLLLISSATAAGAIACAVPTPDPGPDASTAATAIVVLERSSGPGDTVRSDSVGARFVRVRQGSVDDPALRLSGVAEDLPVLGTCVVPSEASAPVQGRNVELLDVGQVTLTSDVTLKSASLLPRTMPDPAGVVSGVVYASRTEGAFAPGAKVSLRASGGPDLLDGFAVNVTAPRDVADVRVTATPGGVDVTWDASDVDVHDFVYVDVLSPAPRVSLRCTAADAGRASLPISAEEGLVSVHRVHKESFRARGIEPGEVRFDFAKIVAFRR
jgi:hypothetical protein